VSLELGVSLVCPVYCSAQTLRILVEEICTCLNGTYKFEILLIDDRSPDSSWLEILQISKENSAVRGIRLGRNVGQHGALLAGIRSARFDKIVTIDDDLQNPPSEVIKLVQALESNGGVVYGVSTDVKQKLWRKASSVGAKQLFKKFLGFDSAVNISSFRAFETNLRDAFSGEIGPSVSIDSLLTWSTSTFWGDTSSIINRCLRTWVSIACSVTSHLLRDTAFSFGNLGRVHRKDALSGYE
jgi:glycosyltransferase involved in cell wall biosynthesis